MNDMIQPLTARGIRVFILIWFGQLVSLLGSGLTGFALGVWVYQRTGSVTQFALISLFATLPIILISPLAGALVDRWSRRWVMIISDSGAALSTLVVALLLFTGNLEIWHIYLANAISSSFSAFQRPAYSAATTLLVPKQHLGRANGMVQLGEAVSRLISPMLAGILLVNIHLQGIILIDFTTFLFAFATLLFVKFPETTKSTIVGQVGIRRLLQETAYGWHYLTARPGLLGLLILFTADNFLIGIVSVLVTPLILSIASAAVLGTIMSIGGLGMLLGSIVMSTWGGPKRKINAVFSFIILSGLCVLAVGLRPSIFLYAISAFLFFFSIPIINSSAQVILQKKVAPNVQGRVFALRGAIVTAAFPLGYVIAGPLADYIFEPLMQTDGILASSIGKLIGTGEGRGISLMFILLGLGLVILTTAAYQYPRLRRVEDELEDHC